MRALTIWQPWASLIMVGAKPFEFRKWAAPKWMWHQRFVIHAGARPVKRVEVDELIRRLWDEKGLGTALDVGPALKYLTMVADNDYRMLTAVGLGTGILGEPKLATELYAGHPDSDRIDHHIYGWPVTDIKPFDEPIPARGAQGFFNWVAS